MQIRLYVNLVNLVYRNKEIKNIKNTEQKMEDFGNSLLDLNSSGEEVSDEGYPSPDAEYENKNLLSFTTNTPFQDDGEIRTLFVSGLPLDTTARELHLLFHNFDGYEMSMLKRGETIDKTTLPVGFVKFTKREKAEAAMAKLIGFQIDPYYNNVLRIDFAKHNTRKSQKASAKETTQQQPAQCHPSLYNATNNAFMPTYLNFAYASSQMINYNAYQTILPYPIKFQATSIMTSGGANQPRTPHLQQQQQQPLVYPNPIHIQQYAAMPANSSYQVENAYVAPIHQYGYNSGNLDKDCNNNNCNNNRKNNNDDVRVDYNIYDGCKSTYFDERSSTIPPTRDATGSHLSGSRVNGNHVTSVEETTYSMRSLVDDPLVGAESGRLFTPLAAATTSAIYAAPNFNGCYAPAISTGFYAPVANSEGCYGAGVSNCYAAGYAPAAISNGYSAAATNSTEAAANFGYVAVDPANCYVGTSPPCVYAAANPGYTPAADSGYNGFQADSAATIETGGQAVPTNGYALADTPTSAKSARIAERTSAYVSSATSLFVANLPTASSEDQLRVLYSCYPGFKNVRLFNKNKTPVAFLDFSDEHSAKKAAKRLNIDQPSNSLNDPEYSLAVDGHVMA